MAQWWGAHLMPEALGLFPGAYEIAGKRIGGGGVSNFCHVTYIRKLKNERVNTDLVSNESREKLNVRNM